MIVFWRLVLAYYAGAVLFYHKGFVAWKEKHPVWGYFIQGVVFLSLAEFVCLPYLTMDWQLAEKWPLPGWAAVLCLSGWYLAVEYLFSSRLNQTHGFTRRFFIHEICMWGAILACSPLHVLYHTGNFMAEPMTVFWVGVLLVTKMFSVFIYRVELDLYGRDFPTLDESFVTMLMRLIFFLMVLLPGWRWLVWLVIWLWACMVARKNRLMDLSPFALYFSAFGAAAVGFLVRFGWYWH